MAFLFTPVLREVYLKLVCRYNIVISIFSVFTPLGYASAVWYCYIFTLPLNILNSDQHPIIFLRCLMIFPSFSGFIIMSAGCASPSMESMSIFSSSMKLRKWWYFMLMCLVRGRILGTRAISAAPSLSSNAVHVMMGFVHPMLKFLVRNSSSSSIIGITRRMTVDSPMYSLSVVLSAISFWS